MSSAYRFSRKATAACRPRCREERQSSRRASQVDKGQFLTTGAASEPARSPILDVVASTVIDIVQEWFGEDLTPGLVERAGRLSVEEALAFADNLDHAASQCQFPARKPGESRPLAVNGFDLKGLLLLADHVAVPNVAMPRRDRNSAATTAGVVVKDLVGGLRQLSRLKPLVAADAVFILPYCLEAYEGRAIDRLRDDPALLAIASQLVPDGERRSATEWLRGQRGHADPPWTERDEKSAWLTFLKDLWVAWPLRLLVSALVVLEIEADPRTDVQVSRNAALDLATIAMLAEGVSAYYEARDERRDELLLNILSDWLNRHGHAPPETDVGLLKVLLELSVPLMDKLSYGELADLRKSEPRVVAYRVALRRGLAVASTSEEWPASATKILRDEMSSARVGLEDTIRSSRVLRQAVSGSRQALIATAGASAGWLSGGTLASTAASSAATLGASSFLNLMAGIHAARRARGFLTPYLVFDASESMGEDAWDLDDYGLVEHFQF